MDERIRRNEVEAGVWQGCQIALFARTYPPQSSREVSLSLFEVRYCISVSSCFGVGVTSWQFLKMSPAVYPRQLSVHIHISSSSDAIQVSSGRLVRSTPISSDMSASPHATRSLPFNDKSAFIVFNI